MRTRRSAEGAKLYGSCEILSRQGSPADSSSGPGDWTRFCTSRAACFFDLVGLRVCEVHALAVVSAFQQPSHTHARTHTHTHTHNGRPEYRRKRGRKQLALISIAVVFANTQAVSTRWRGFFQTFCATCRGWIVFLRPATSAGACLSVDIHMYICIYVHMYISIHI